MTAARRSRADAWRAAARAARAASYSTASVTALFDYTPGFSMSEPAAKRVCAGGSAGTGDLSMSAIISRNIGGFVGASGEVSFAIRSLDSGKRLCEHLELRKLWDAVSAPRIEVIRHSGALAEVIQELAFTPANSEWSANWSTTWRKSSPTQLGMVGGGRLEMTSSSRRRSPSLTCRRRP